LQVIRVKFNLFKDEKLSVLFAVQFVPHTNVRIT